MDDTITTEDIGKTVLLDGKDQCKLIHLSDINAQVIIEGHDYSDNPAYPYHNVNAERLSQLKEDIEDDFDIVSKPPFKSRKIKVMKQKKREYQRCPVCDDNGTISPYTSQMNQGGTSVDPLRRICPTCNGSLIIERPIS